MKQRYGPDVAIHCTVIFFMVVKSMMLDDLNQESEMENLQLICLWSSDCSCLVIECDLTQN